MMVSLLTSTRPELQLPRSWSEKSPAMAKLIRVLRRIKV